MHTRMPQEECSSSSSTHGVRSILLSGAELARLKDLWSVQLFFAPDSSREQEEEVELRCKSGISVESAVPFNWNRAATDYSSGGKLVLTQGVSSADSPIVVLKSRAVIQAEKERQSSTRWSSEQTKKKKRAFSMDESSLLGRLGDPVGASRNEIFGSARRPAVPLPLPLPPDKEEFNHSHRRHLSIDLRASPAAKFLVQVMQWEAGEEQLGSRASMGSNSSHCYVPFKWEEAPGKPKSNGENGFTAGGARKLRLPPRLQQLDHLGSASLSPTSTLDHVVDSSSSSPNAGCSSSSLDPNETRTRTRKVLRAILALHIWQLWTKKIPKESAKMPRESSVVKNTANYNSSWSPSPRPFWLRSTKHDRTSRPDNWRKDWALQKIASGCNVVKRAVRMRWWSYTKVSGSKKKRKSGKIAYRPLLCSVDGDSTAFACSSSSAL